MDREQIIQWAREAAKNHPDYKADEEIAALPDAMVTFLEAFAKKVRDDYSNKHAQLWLKRIDEAVKAEREACAMVCEELPAPDIYDNSDKSMWDVTCIDCAEAIRARSNP
jgi:hypothetical protein